MKLQVNNSAFKICCKLMMMGLESMLMMPIKVLLSLLTVMFEGWMENWAVLMIVHSAFSTWSFDDSKASSSLIFSLQPWFKQVLPNLNTSNGFPKNTTKTIKKENSWKILEGSIHQFCMKINCSPFFTDNFMTLENAEEKFGGFSFSVFPHSKILEKNSHFCFSHVFNIKWFIKCFHNLKFYIFFLNFHSHRFQCNFS